MAAPVLIVEDDLDIRDSLQLVLESCGYEVLTAEHGIQALTLLGNGRPEPQAIILDLRMPHMDGETFLEELRKQQRDALFPRVIVASADTTATARVARFGVAKVLRKPFSAEALLDTLEALTASPLAAALK